MLSQHLQICIVMWQLVLICHFSSISQHQSCSLFLLHHFAIVFFSFLFIIFMRKLFAIHHCPQICTNIVALLFFGCMSIPLQLMQNQIHVFFLCDNILIFINFLHDVSNLFVATLLQLFWVIIIFKIFFLCYLFDFTLFHCLFIFSSPPYDQ